MSLLLAAMTQELFRADSYLTECSATVTAIGPHGIVLDRTVFYPMGGGQAGDAGVLVIDSGAGAGKQVAIADTRKGKDAEGRFTSDICQSHTLLEHIHACKIMSDGGTPTMDQCDGMHERAKQYVGRVWYVVSATTSQLKLRHFHMAVPDLIQNISAGNETK